LNAMPVWADALLIQQFYDCCTAHNKQMTTGVRWHVDHIVPLQSPLVCGLHTHDNLRVVTGSANLSKSNRYWPDMWEEPDSSRPSADSPERRNHRISHSIGTPQFPGRREPRLTRIDINV
jgi:hypothetical protein